MPGVKGRSGGRNAKTRAQHDVEGTTRLDRHAHENPQPPQGAPPVPEGLAGVALEEWGRMLGRLSQSQTLSVVDDGALFQYCRMFAETEAIALSQLETAGSVEILEDNLAKIEKADLVAVFQEITKLRQLEARYTTQVRQGRMALRAYLVEFGLTPAARSRVKVIGSPKDDTPRSPLDTLRAQAQTLRRVK